MNQYDQGYAKGKAAAKRQDISMGLRLSSRQSSHRSYDPVWWAGWRDGFTAHIHWRLVV